MAAVCLLVDACANAGAGGKKLNSWERPERRNVTSLFPPQETRRLTQRAGRRAVFQQVHGVIFCAGTVLCGQRFPHDEGVCCCPERETIVRSYCYVRTVVVGQESGCLRMSACHTGAIRPASLVPVRLDYSTVLKSSS